MSCQLVAGRGFEPPNPGPDSSSLAFHANNTVSNSRGEIFRAARELAIRNRASEIRPDCFLHQAFVLLWIGDVRCWPNHS